MPSHARRALVRLPLCALLAALAAAPLSAARGRPFIANGTLVSDTGSPLRGDYWSVDITGQLPNDQWVKNLRVLGLNALHVYAEDFHCGYAPGTYVALIDQLVNWTDTQGLYLILTLGNGVTEVGATPSCRENMGEDWDRTFTRQFWNIYAPRYKLRTHVIYEVHNEPYYVNGTSQPFDSRTRNFERDMFNLIRLRAPQSPILVFSYNVFRNGPAVMQDVNWMNANSNINWSNAAIAFHGYAPALAETRDTLNYVKSLGIPVMQTEFFDTVHWLATGKTEARADVAQLELYEDTRTSWLGFLLIGPNRIESPANFKAHLDANWIVWVTDRWIAWVTDPCLNCTWPAISDPPVGGTVSLRSTSANLWARATGAAAQLIASAPSVGTTEKYTVVAAPGGYYVALRALANNRYVSAGSTLLYASSTGLGSWEQFEWLKREDGTVLLRARPSNKFVSADHNLNWSTPPLVADRTRGGIWERFTLLVQ